MAQKKNEDNGKMDAGKMVGGLAILGAVAAAGAYFLYGTKEGGKQRKKINGWMLKAKGEVLERLEKVKDLSEDKYVKTVADVISKYRKLKKDHGDEVELLSKELIGYWKHIKKELGNAKAKEGSAKRGGSKSKGGKAAPKK